MRRTEWLQETRKMRFEEAYGGWQGGRLRQEEAARLLGVCERIFRRYIDRYEEAGLDGLIDRRLQQLSRRRAPQAPRPGAVAGDAAAPGRLASTTEVCER